MESQADVEAELHAFAGEISARGWRVRLTRYRESMGVCVQIERRMEGVAEPIEALEICRSTVARVVESARKHIFPRRMS